MQLPQCLGLVWRRCAYGSLPGWCATACHGGSCGEFGNIRIGRHNNIHHNYDNGRHNLDNDRCLSRVGVAMWMAVACPNLSVVAPDVRNPGCRRRTDVMLCKDWCYGYFDTLGCTLIH
jgi:hypothetical protein